MKNSNSKKQARKKGKLTRLVTAGAIIGTGVAVAGAVAMSDKKNQKKVKEMAGNIKNQMESKKDEVEKKVKKIGTIIKDAADEVKKI